MPRAAQLNVRLEDDEAHAIQEAADAAGLSTSEWARTVMRVAAGQHALLDQLQRVQGQRRDGAQFGVQSKKRSAK
jgi:uncharacterized protein (DUF1778 family)